MYWKGERRKQLFSSVKVTLENSFMWILSPATSNFKFDGPSHKFTFIFLNIIETYFWGLMSF